MKNIKVFIFAGFIQIFTSFCMYSFSVEKIAELKCGLQPKQVLFSPDNSCLVLPLLDDKGFHVIDINGDATTSSTKARLVCPPSSDKLGYVEGLFISEKKSFLVSQMTTGKIYEYEYQGNSTECSFSYKREIKTKGTWSKFIVYSREKNTIAVSNWVSNDVSLIDYSTGDVIRIIKTAAAPRGLAFINGGKEIIVLCFDGGIIQKFDTETGKLTASLSIEKSAMRHIVLSSDEKKAYVSDMYHACVYELNLATFRINATWKVFNNPNTIELLDDRYLFVSCRGPNNKIDYTKRSPVNGKIYILDVKDGSVVHKIEGGNQPTGLALSSDGKYLCFTNFQDANCELFKIIR